MLPRKFGIQQGKHQIFIDIYYWTTNMGDKTTRTWHFSPAKKDVDHWTDFFCQEMMQKIGHFYCSNLCPSDLGIEFMRLEETDLWKTCQWEISRILKWRYCTIFLAIFCGDIPLHRPYIGLIYGRYLQFRILKIPLILLSVETMRTTTQWWHQWGGFLGCGSKPWYPGFHSKIVCDECSSLVNCQYCGMVIHFL